MLKTSTINEQVAKVYKDCNWLYEDYENRLDEAIAQRDLRWKTQEAVTRDEAIKILERHVGELNEFTPELLYALPNDAMIYIAREYSMCIYVEGNISDNIVVGNLKCDECDYIEELNQTRIWWD